jgi:hypothetical protein
MESEGKQNKQKTTEFFKIGKKEHMEASGSIHGVTEETKPFQLTRQRSPAVTKCGIRPATTFVNEITFPMYLYMLDRRQGGPG